MSGISNLYLNGFVLKKTLISYMAFSYACHNNQSTNTSNYHIYLSHLNILNLFRHEIYWNSICTNQTLCYVHDIMLYHVKNLPVLSLPLKKFLIICARIYIKERKYSTQQKSVWTEPFLFWYRGYPDTNQTILLHQQLSCMHM